MIDQMTQHYQQQIMPKEEFTTPAAQLALFAKERMAKQRALSQAYQGQVVQQNRQQMGMS